MTATRRTADATRLREIWGAAIAAVDPGVLVERHLSVRGARVGIGIAGSRLWVPRDRLWVAGAGKAALAMAQAVAMAIPEIEGAVIAPSRSRQGRSAESRSGSVARVGRIRVLPGEHPIPGRGSFSATRALVRELARQPDDATVLLLLSGGASALLALPAPGIRDRDKVRLFAEMLRAGMPIAEMNEVRKLVSAVKGGGLLRLAAPRPVVTLALSDVPGDDLGTIGSGPSIQRRIDRRAARRALLRHVEPGSVPAAVLARLGSGASHEEPRRRGGRRRRSAAESATASVSRASVIGSNRTALAAAAARARELGYSVRHLRWSLTGDARSEGERVAQALRRAPSRPTVVLAGGETVVDARGARGRGGRSQELALAASPGIEGSRWLLLAAGTDGIDGDTPAAGALVDGATATRMGAEEVARALAEHDSHGAFSRFGGLFVTGPTGTNVMDIVIALHPGRAASHPSVVERLPRRSSPRLVGRHAE